MERLVNDYFNCHIAPIMSKTRTDLIRNQGEEMKEYSTSLGGILSMMASSAQPMSDPYQALKVTGEWNSKTTEDYIEMCKTEITGSEEMQQDLATEQEHSFVMEMLKRMKIKATSIEEKPLRRMTIEEYRAMAKRAIADAEAGRTISQSEMEKRVASWR